ncbi:Prefoldin [Neoconidiobolus thromboides FSU 785]|nr:Prefoldin [Neoconidiobolus thromboides FSU 785]
MSAIAKQLELESQNFQSLQKEFNQALDSRTKLESQLRENKAVEEEFKHLEDDADIFKLIGPVLVKQEKNEAKSNVDKRIQFIQREIERIEDQIKDLTSKQDKKREEIIKLQTSYQAEQTKA